MSETLDRGSNSATRFPLAAAGSAHVDGLPDIRAEHRLHGWIIALGASLVLWGGIFAVVRLVGAVLA